MPRHHGKFVSYLRVSTKRQGESGLGLEAQRKAVADFLNGGNWQLVEELVEEQARQADQPDPRCDHRVRAEAADRAAVPHRPDAVAGTAGRTVQPL